LLYRTKPTATEEEEEIGVACIWIVCLVDNNKERVDITAPRKSASYLPSLELFLDRKKRHKRLSIAKTLGVIKQKKNTST